MKVEPYLKQFAKIKYGLCKFDSRTHALNYQFLRRALFVWMNKIPRKHRFQIFRFQAYLNFNYWNKEANKETKLQERIKEVKKTQAHATQPRNKQKEGSNNKQIKDALIKKYWREWNKYNEKSLKQKSKLRGF
jgi:hypothetical protein